jgi:integrase
VLFRHDGKQRSKTFDQARGAKKFRDLIDKVGVDEALAIYDLRVSGTSDVEILADWARAYIDQLTGVTAGTRKRYELMIAKQMPELAPLPLDAVNPAAISKWVNAMSKQGLSGKTIANRHGFLSGVMKAAVRAGHVPSNPCDGTRIPKTERGEMVFLTPQEFAIFLSFVRPDAQDLVSVLPATGLRWGEVTALQPRDIDLEHGLLTVSRSWKWTDSKEHVLGPPKTKRSRRTIALPRQTVEVFARCMEGKASTDLIFTNTQGRPWRGPRFHSAVWQPAARAALPAIGKKPRVHDMRHTCASWMIRAGVSLPVVQRHLGHESITTSVDRYGHLEPAHLAMAATALTDAMTFSMPQIEA